MYALRMKNIVKVYGNGIMANNDVNLNVEKGEIHALMGENGAGKSTLMKMLFGIEKCDSGEIYINEEKVTIESPSHALALGIGMVHQHFMLTPSMTVAENLILGCEPKKGIFLDMKKAISQTEDICRKFNFNLDPKARVKDLPVGAKQQIEILKALYRDAKILILDEPTAVLTPQETERLFVQLRLLKESGYTIIFISHHINEVLDLCDRVTVMRAGKSVGEMDLRGGKKVTAQDIANAMVGREAVIHVDKGPAKPGQPVLQVQGACYISLEGKAVVDDVSFSVRSGEILAVGGVEGNGQTELVKMITGLSPIDVGDIKINGESIRKSSIKKLREKKMSYIPQDRMNLGVATEGTIDENLSPYIRRTEEYNRFGVLKLNKLTQTAREVIDEFDVRCEGPNQLVKMLSGGNIQKVVVGRELSYLCRKDKLGLVVAEQPTRGIDVIAANLVHKKLVEMRDRGLAILIVTADLNELLELADSAIIMYQGKIAAYFPEIKDASEDQLGQYMLGVKQQSREEIEKVVF